LIGTGGIDFHGAVSPGWKLGAGSAHLQVPDDSVARSTGGARPLDVQLFAKIDVAEIFRALEKLRPLLVDNRGHLQRNLLMSCRFRIATEFAQ
jgi:hypothetical protein